MKKWLALVVLLPVGVVHAADVCSAAEYRQFDFWLGQWAVHGVQGQLAGHNHISAAEQGCLVLEQWRSAAGGTGQSYNFYDPGRKQWRQVWVSAGVAIDYQGGLDADGAMHLAGTIAYHADGRQAPFRGTWSPRADGTVRQLLEEFSAAEDAWLTWFDGIYRPLSVGEKSD